MNSINGINHNFRISIPDKTPRLSDIIGLIANNKSKNQNTPLSDFIKLTINKGKINIVVIIIRNDINILLFKNFIIPPQYLLSNRIFKNTSCYLIISYKKQIIYDLPKKYHLFYINTFLK